jgi:hypothetical protein
VRRTQAGYRYYLCRGRTDALRVAQGQRCSARYIPAEQLDELVWADLCALLADPAQVAGALERARGGAWLPQELQARQQTICQALGQLERQQQRLLDAYLAEVVELAELERKRQALDRRRATLLAQQHQLDAVAEQRLELRAVADGIEAFCQTVRAGLATATFAQRRLLVELLIDRVVITDGEVEIRYVLPTSPDGPHPPFCQLRKDHLIHPAPPLASCTCRPVRRSGLRCASWPSCGLPGAAVGYRARTHGVPACPPVSRPSCAAARSTMAWSWPTTSDGVGWSVQNSTTPLISLTQVSLPAEWWAPTAVGNDRSAWSSRMRWPAGSW